MLIFNSRKKFKLKVYRLMLQRLDFRVIKKKKNIMKNKIKIRQIYFFFLLFKMKIYKVLLNCKIVVGGMK